jgi:porin
MVSDSAGLFINGTFGWPASFGSDLPSGGPNYPLAGPGIRLAIKAGKATTIRLAVFSGDPAGPGKGDPQRRDLHGFNGLKFAGKPFIIAEAEQSPGGADPDWTLRLGGWVHRNRFADLRFDGSGGSLASPTSNGKPLMHRGNLAVYGIAEIKFWRSRAEAGRNLSGFFRASFSPPNRNLIDLYADAGLALTGPLRGRPADIVGIGVAVARISPRLRALVRDRNRLGGAISPIPDFEAVIECSYQAQLATHIYVQPNIQYIIHPNGGMTATNNDLGDSTANALVIGLRTSARF